MKTLLTLILFLLCTPAMATDEYYENHPKIYPGGGDIETIKIHQIELKLNSLASLLGYEWQERSADSTDYPKWGKRVGK